MIVCNVPDYGTEEVADHAIMLLLATVRRLVPSHMAIRAGRGTTGRQWVLPGSGAKRSA